MPPPELIEIPLPKSCLLVLTVAEYNKGLARGKARRRRQRLEARLAQRAHEAETLARGEPDVPEPERRLRPWIR